LVTVAPRLALGIELALGLAERRAPSSRVRNRSGSSSPRAAP